MNGLTRTTLALCIAALGNEGWAQAGAQAGTSAPDGQGGTMERIVVTANRRDQLVQDTPLAVTAFTQDTLQNNQVKDLASLTAMVPGLVVEPHSDSGGVHVYMRGVGSANHTELGDPAVAFYVDGIYLPRPQGATALMYDLSHVEVARGPQGTLNGRNSTAGAVNLVSAAPNTTKTMGSFSVTAGDYHRIQTQGMINIPFGDNVALRVAAIKDTHDGYVDFARGSNVPPGADKYGAQDQAGARATLLWKITPNLRANFIADYYEDKGAGNVYLAQESSDRWSAVIDTPGTLNQSITTYKTKWNWAANDWLDVQYLASWSRLKRSNASDADAGMYLGFKAENRTEWGQFDSHSNELQLRSAGTGPVEWVAGLFEFGEKNRIRFDIDRSQISEAALRQDLAAGNVIFVQPTVGEYASAMSFIQGDRQLKSKAVFAQGSYSINAQYKVTAGARYTKDHKFDKGGQNWACPNWPDNAPRGTTVLTPSQIAQLVTPGTGLIKTHNIGPGGLVTVANCGNTPGDNTADLEYGQATWLGRVEYKPAKDILAFASVTTGFHSPAIGDGGATTKPEKLTSYEIGIKSDLLNRALTLNLDAFWMKYKDKLESQVVNNTLQNFNAAGATVKGIEAEFAWRPFNAARISGNATWLRATYDSFLSCDIDAARANGQTCGTTAPTEDVGGSVLKHAPRFATTLMAEYDLPVAGGRLTPRIQAHHETTSFVAAGAFNRDVPGHPGVKQQDAYTTLDVSLRYEPANKAYTAELFVNNATDKEVKYDAVEVCTQVGAPCQPNQQIWAAYYNQPRTVGARLSMKF